MGGFFRPWCIFYLSVTAIFIIGTTDEENYKFLSNNIPTCSAMT